MKGQNWLLMPGPTQIATPSQRPRRRDRRRRATGPASRWPAPSWPTGRSRWRHSGWHSLSLLRCRSGPRLAPRHRWVACRGRRPPGDIQAVTDGNCEARVTGTGGSRLFKFALLGPGPPDSVESRAGPGRGTESESEVQARARRPGRRGSGLVTSKTWKPHRDSPPGAARPPRRAAARARVTVAAKFKCLRRRSRSRWPKLYITPRP